MFERARDGADPSYEDIIKRIMEEPFGFDHFKVLVERIDDPFIAGGTKILLRSHPDRPAGLRATMHNLRRYRQSAEAGAGRPLLHGFRAQAKVQKYETKPITTLSCNHP